ncbi:MAG TPA: hypothetical protein VJT08_05610 [Terriglobales bacterium]|nr:hypothetical protein [Terriglobales bacterium]
MEDLLFALVELLLEFLLEFTGEIVLDLLSRMTLEALQSEEPRYPIGTAFGCFAFGALAGAITLAAFPHPLIHRSRIHGISLILSPLITGAVMSGLGALLRKRGKRVVQIESFPYAFAFAFGMALIRLFFAA